ncbi:DUF2092 domain-containing protein [Accumulibacter sp.]|uniref:DUF2092 domain-containing protein n=1 Tax=Accumulibacter sp. TaxID=2053492 RepID=UPI0028C44DFD|nr:DUF2092 domain-containing protein [Accumulibacter sp.]
MNKTKLIKALVGWAAGALLAAVPVLAQSAGVEALAERLLKNSTTYLAEQQEFSVNARSTIEAVLETGQKVQFDSAAKISVQRPNKLRAERRGELVDQVLAYDGKSLTLYNLDRETYATVAAPGTLEEMLDFARTKLDIVAPAGDLLYRNAFEILMDNVTSGFVVGKAVVAGVRCDHLAFRGAGVDWQIWIQEGRQPLPQKLVITSTEVASLPQFTVVMTNWNRAPKFNRRTFAFKPPKAAKKVDFLPLAKGGSQ